MMIGRLAQALALCGVAALGIFSVTACNPTPRPNTPPPAPILLSLEIPNDTFGNGFSGVTPAIRAAGTTPANYFVLPLLPTTAPIVRVVLALPTNSVLSMTATDASTGQTVTLPIISPPGPSSPGPTTGYFYLHSITSNSSLFYIRYPNTFQGSRSIRTMITATVGGVASAPLTFDMSFRGSTLTVSIATENNDGRVTSNPPGIDCPGVCTAVFLNTTSVLLGQSVTHNQTQFMGWTGSCIGSGNSCTVPLLLPGPAIIPMNPAVTANFRIHTNTAIPSAMTCPAPPMLPNKQWVTQPNCGNSQFAILQCDSIGYFCCGAQGGTPSPRCNGQNLTAVTCSTSQLFGGPVTHELIQPGGCYVTVP
ncbi:MAG: hypothetical protein WBK08_17355 [Nitrospira sp.]|nr:MAG: hypothetical protein E8D42_11650 [Nitrospira sp.]